jgi:hypothetical protein
MPTTKTPHTLERTIPSDSTQSHNNAESATGSQSIITQEEDRLAHEEQGSTRAHTTTAGQSSSPLQHPPAATQTPVSREPGLNREPPPMENRASTSSENVLHNNELFPNKPKAYTQLSKFTPHPDSHYLLSAECPFSGGSIAPEEDDFPIILPVTFMPLKSENASQDASIKNKNGQQFFRVYEFSDLNAAYEKQKAGKLPSEGWREVFVGHDEIPPPSEWLKCDLQKLKNFYEEQPKREKINNEKELKLQSTFSDLLKESSYINLKEKMQELIRDIDFFLDNDQITSEVIDNIKKSFEDIFNNTWLKEYAKRYSQTISMQEFKEIIFSSDSELHKRRQPAHDLFYNFKKINDDIKSLPTPEDLVKITIATQAIQQLLTGRSNMKDIKKMHAGEVIEWIIQKFKIENKKLTDRNLFQDTRYLIYNYYHINYNTTENITEMQSNILNNINRCFPNLKALKPIPSKYTILMPNELNEFIKFKKLKYLDLSYCEIYLGELKTDVDFNVLKRISGYSIYHSLNMDNDLDKLNWIPQKLKKIRIVLIKNLSNKQWEMISQKLEEDGTLTFFSKYSQPMIRVFEIPPNLRSRVVSYQVNAQEITPEHIKDILENFQELKEINFLEENSQNFLHDYIKSWGQTAHAALLQKGIQIHIRNIVDDKIYVPNERRTAYKLAEDDEIAFY